MYSTAENWWKLGTGCKDKGTGTKMYKCLAGNLGKFLSVCTVYNLYYDIYKNMKSM